ncbi:MAG: 50S ribosome-binding GTPase [Candidatus Delongbacteria bacterium]|jgi:[FeFe] hydrogenase H-cluster maturation GTPase HydF|nr:50S ribosome-binding GTPase [Candidatus Delongbacteria bacterium]
MKRINIGLFGRVNSGKSTLMNLLTQHETSIVDSTPGTTADVKTIVMEIHELGPVKIFDTAGLDEQGVLGDKKKEKTFNALKRSDIVLLVINENNEAYSTDEFSTEKEIISMAKKRGKELFIIYNKFSDVNPVKNIISAKIDPNHKFISTELELAKKSNYIHLIDFIKKNSKLQQIKTPLLPNMDRDKIVFLNIPIDEESPEGRFLRPQMMIEEYLVRRFVPTFAYRMDLGKARSIKSEEVAEEKKRFDEYISHLNRDDKVQLLITDSQGMDIIAKWTKDYNFMVTTFSIVMINFLSRGNLEMFVNGIRAFEDLKPGDKVMIAEGCNHDRKGEDIGTVQIPRKMDKLFGKDQIQVDHYFGRVFAGEENLKEYKLVIHCGGCMLDQQAIAARIEDLIESGVSFTNYGVLLSYFEGKDALNKVIEPFGLKI